EPREVGRDGAVAGGGHRRQHVAPHVGGLGVAVQQQGGPARLALRIGRAEREAHETSRSFPVSTSYTNPRTLSLFGMNGEFLIRVMLWRTSPSRSSNASAAHSGFWPVSCSICFLNSSSVKVSIPQSVWWMRMISSVPSRRWEIASERISSSVTTPPA